MDEYIFLKSILERVEALDNEMAGIRLTLDKFREKLYELRVDLMVATDILEVIEEEGSEDIE